MKRETRLFLLITLTISVLLFIQFNPINKKSAVETRVIELPDFQKMEIDLPYNVFLIEGKANSMVVQGPVQDISRIFYEIKDAELNIRHKRPQWIKNWVKRLIYFRSDIKIYVTVKDLSQINVTSSKAFSIRKKIPGDPVGWLLNTSRKVWKASSKSFQYVYS